MKLLRLGVVLAVLVALVPLAMLLLKRERPPNVVLISIDTLRQDHVSAYGYPRATTPETDRMAGEGVLFENARSTAPWTAPAHASMFTGLPPSVHQLETREDRLRGDLTLLASLFKQNGYATAAFLNCVYFDRKYGMSEGFDTYDVANDDTAERVTQKALDWLSGRGRKPFLLFVHYFTPHWDLEPPDPFRGMFASRVPDLLYGTYEHLRGYIDPGVPMPDAIRSQIVALYDGEIRYTDQQIGRLLAYLDEQGLRDDTIVVVTSDHGEEFKEHDSFGHAMTLHAEVNRVPLIVRYPGRLPPGRRLTHPVQISDLPATLAELAGIPVAGQFVTHAKSLTPLFEQAPGAPAVESDRVLFVETTAFGPKSFAVVKGDHKFVTRASAPYPAGPRRGDGFRKRLLPATLYCIKDDPHETANLLADGAAADHRCGDRHYDLDALRADLLREIDRFVRENVSGVRLVCGGPGEPPVGYSGRAQFEKALVDEPFSTSFEPGDDVTGTGVYDDGDKWYDIRWRDYRFSFEVRDREKVIVFPVPDDVHRMTLTLMRDGQPLYRGVMEFPPPGSTEEIPATEGACRLDGGNRRTGSGRVALSDEQLEKLRSLGYVQ